MKMGNIVPRAGIEPTSLAFRASVLPVHHVGFLMSPLYPYLLVHATPCFRGQCRLLHLPLWNCKSVNAYNYVHTGNSLTHIHTQGNFNKQTAHNLYSILVMAPVSWMWWTLGNIVPRVGIKLTSLAFQASVLPLHTIGSLMSPLYPCLHIYAAPCPRGQCRLLQIVKYITLEWSR